MSTMSVKEWCEQISEQAAELAESQAQNNTRLAANLTEKGVEADGSETTTALIDKVAQIPQGGFDYLPYLVTGTFGAGISEITEDITLHLEGLKGLGNLFDLIPINAPKVTVYINDNCNNFSRAFGRANGFVKVIEIIGNTSKVTNFTQCFESKENLEQVICEFDFSSAQRTDVMFYGNLALKEVRLKANTLSISISLLYSPLLSAESKQSIVDAFADMTGQTSITLTLHKDVVLTEEQKATLTLKNITLVQ